MSDTKNKEIVAKLQIVKELATENSVKQLASVMIEYIDANTKGELGFKNVK